MRLEYKTRVRPGDSRAHEDAVRLDVRILPGDVRMASTRISRLVGFAPRLFFRSCARRAPRGESCHSALAGIGTEAKKQSYNGWIS